jgi:hypothetical protein
MAGRRTPRIRLTRRRSGPLRHASVIASSYQNPELKH